MTKSNNNHVNPHKRNHLIYIKKSKVEFQDLRCCKKLFRYCIFSLNPTKTNSVKCITCSDIRMYILISWSLCTAGFFFLFSRISFYRSQIVLHPDWLWKKKTCSWLSEQPVSWLWWVCKLGKTTTFNRFEITVYCFNKYLSKALPNLITRENNS